MCKNSEIEKLNNWKERLKSQIKLESNDFKKVDLFVTIANINKQIQKINNMEV